MKGSTETEKAARGQYGKYGEVIRKGEPRLSTRLKKMFGCFG